MKQVYIDYESDYVPSSEAQTTNAYAFVCGDNVYILTYITARGFAFFPLFNSNNTSVFEARFLIESIEKAIRNDMEVYEFKSRKELLNFINEQVVK